MRSVVAAHPLTRSIAELSREDVPYAGGKGANLGELTGAGLPVPDGFVVGAPTCARFVQRGRGGAPRRLIATAEKRVLLHAARVATERVPSPELRRRR
jgi:phosphoenolpyruvate synthase/pyruvate phosphate dikinase